MKIKLNNNTVIHNVKKFVNVSLISKTTRMFYELGRYIDYNHTEYVKFGIFKEITDPIKFCTHNNLINDKDYIKHHNFVIKF